MISSNLKQFKAKLWHLKRIFLPVAEADRAKNQAGIGLNCRSGKTSETKFSAKVSHRC